MAKNIKELLTDRQPRNNGTLSAVYTLAGGYMIYLAYDIIKLTRRGESGVSMQVAVITGIVFVLIGIAILIYAFRLWKLHQKELTEAQAEAAAASAQAEAQLKEEALAAVLEEEAQAAKEAEEQE